MGSRYTPEDLKYIYIFLANDATLPRWLIGFSNEELHLAVGNAQFLRCHGCIMMYPYKPDQDGLSSLLSRKTKSCKHSQDGFESKAMALC